MGVSRTLGCALRSNPTQRILTVFFRLRGRTRRGCRFTATRRRRAAEEEPAGPGGAADGQAPDEAAEAAQARVRGVLLQLRREWSDDGAAERQQCFETCRHSADSDCDDGGPGAEYALCHFSTDCTDCGVRIAGEVRTGRTGWCIPRGSFVNLDFNEARLYRSNIGGQGGRCWIADQCDEQLVDTDATDIGLLAGANTVHEMYIRGVATNSIDPLYAAGGPLGGGEQVDLVVTNTTEYKSWDTSWNWVKQEGALEALLSGETLGRGGGFVGTNLAGARQVDQPGVTSGWSETFTACEFLYQFVTGDPSNRRPITIPRTYISIYVSEPRAPPLAHGPWPAILGARAAVLCARATRTHMLLHMRQEISSHQALRGSPILPWPFCRVVVVQHAL